MEPVQERYEFNLKPKQEVYRIGFLFILTMAFFILFFKTPTIDLVKLSQLNGHMMRQRRRYAIFSTDNYIYLAISAVLVLTFSLLLKMEKRYPDEDDDRSGTTTILSSLFRYKRIVFDFRSSRAHETTSYQRSS